MAVDQAVSKWAVREAFFFNQGANIAVWTIYMSLNVSMAVWGIWEFAAPHWHTESDILRITLPIARAGGRLVTFNVAILLITASKYVWTLIRQYTVIPLGFPVDNIMPEYHRMVAWFIIVSGCVVHTIPQIINYATEEIPILDDKPVWTLGDGFSTKQLLYTGSLLFCIFSMFLITTLQKVRHTSWGFRLFWVTHVFGIVTAFPLLLIHGTIRGMPILLYFTLFPLGLYLGDCIIRRFVYVSREANVLEWSAHEDQGERVTKLVLGCPGFEYTPGQYAELKIPEISHHEWHPFTIASAPIDDDGTVTFYIKSVGRWTNQLYEIVSSHKDEEQQKTPIIHVRGPHGAPAQNYFAYQHLVVIGSGIGVTPLLSVWQYLVHKGSKLVCEPIKSSRLAAKISEQENEKESELQLLDRVGKNNINSVDVVSLEKTPMTTIRGKSAYYASVLESMTVNICLFCASVTMETVVFSVWIFRHDEEAAVLQIVISWVALIIFGSKILLSAYAYGINRYGRSTVCLLEVSIVLLDLGAMIGAFTTLDSPSRESAIAYFSFFAAYVCLHGVRIFHIFHSTARPPRIAEDNTQEQAVVNKIHSITGIWVSKYFSSMSFAAMDVVQTLPGLSPVFSLVFYGTRESQNNTWGSFAEMERGNHATRAGRPEWDSLLHQAISRAHATNPEGGSVGIFFCGSPAIARVLQSTAQQVTAEHQYGTGKLSGTPCHCRLLVHKENF
jgi:respiratory burst oxidase